MAALQQVIVSSVEFTEVCILARCRLLRMLEGWGTYVLIGESTGLFSIGVEKRLGKHW